MSLDIGSYQRSDKCTTIHIGDIIIGTATIITDIVIDILMIATVIIITEIYTSGDLMVAAGGNL